MNPRTNVPRPARSACSRSSGRSRPWTRWTGTRAAIGAQHHQKDSVLAGNWRTSSTVRRVAYRAWKFVMTANVRSDSLGAGEGVGVLTSSDALAGIAEPNKAPKAGRVVAGPPECRRRDRCPGACVSQVSSICRGRRQQIGTVIWSVPKTSRSEIFGTQGFRRSARPPPPQRDGRRHRRHRHR